MLNIKLLIFLGGHPVDLVDKDNGSNPATAAVDAQQLVADHVAVIFDLGILDVVWQKTVDAAKIPVVGGAFTSEPYYSDPLCPWCTAPRYRPPRRTTRLSAWQYYPGLTANALAWSEFAAQAWTGGLPLQAAAKNAGWSASGTAKSARAPRKRSGFY